MSEEQDNASLHTNTVGNISGDSKDETNNDDSSSDIHPLPSPSAPSPPQIPESPPQPTPPVQEPPKEPPPKKDRASKAREVLAQKRAQSTLANLYKKQKEIEEKLARGSNNVPPIPIRIEITNPEGKVKEIITPKPIPTPIEKETPNPTIPTAPMSSEDEFEVRRIEGQDDVAVETKKEKNGGKKRKRDDPRTKEKKSARKSKSKNVLSEEDEETPDGIERDEDDGGYGSKQKEKPRKKAKLAPVLVESDEEDGNDKQHDGLFKSGYNMARDNIRNLNIGGTMVDYSKSAATTLAWAFFLSGVYYLRSRIESQLASYQAQLLAGSYTSIPSNPPQNRPVDNFPAPETYRKLEPTYNTTPANAFRPSPFQQYATPSPFTPPQTYVPSPNHQ